MTGKSPTVLVIALILTNISRGHPNSAPESPYVALVRCRTIQLQLEDGKPVADVPVRLKVMRTKMTKRNNSGIEEEVDTFKVLRKLKTDAAGEIQFPELSPGSYILALPKTKKFTEPFGFLMSSKPGDCIQEFVLEDKGFMVEKGQEKLDKK